jgi:hypothetical protein
MGAGDEIIIPGTTVVKEEPVMKKLVLEDTEIKPPAPSHTPSTYELIKKAKDELRDWHVQWGKKPQADGRAAESAARLREFNDAAIKRFKLPGQDKMSGKKAEKERVRNLLHISQFCRRLDKILGPAIDGGSRIFLNKPPSAPGIESGKLMGLFIKIRGMDNFTFHEDLPVGWKKICAVQVPYMSEWGVMNLDDRGMFKSWKYIGWRGQVLLRLILQGAITKEEAHNEFGVPQGTDVDREYLKILEAWERNGKRTN